MICLTTLVLIAITFTKTFATNPHYRLQMTPTGKPFFRVGETLALNCKLIPIDAKIFPLRLTLPINSPPLETRIHISQEPNNLTVTIRPLHVNDTGWYTCEALDRSEPMSQSIYVTIQAEHRGDCQTDTFFSCGSRLCIPKRYVCDGFTDCPNDNDERPELCGPDPCDNKISCEDGRCIPKEFCCLKQLDPSCPINNLVPCCADYLDQLATIKPVKELAFKDNLIRSTVYTIASCAIVVFFFLALLILAVYRIHTRRSLLVARSAQHNQNQFMSGGQRNDDCIYDNASNEMFEPIDPIDLDLAYNQYETDDMMQSISQIPKPPLYSEALNHPIMPYNEPPPPYSPRHPTTPTVQSTVVSPEPEATSSSCESPEESAHILVIQMNTNQVSDQTNHTNTDGTDT